MRRPRPLPAEERRRRRALREARRIERRLTPSPEVTADAVRGARWGLGLAVGGLVAGVAGAALFAADPAVEALRWGLALGGRSGGAVVADVDVARGDLVALAAVITGLPVPAGVVGVLRTPARASGARRAAWRTSWWSVLAGAGAIAAAPNVLGCYLVARAGWERDAIVLPMLWPQLSPMIALLAVAGMGRVLDRRRGRRRQTRRTLSGRKVPV